MNRFIPTASLCAILSLSAVAGASAPTPASCNRLLQIKTEISLSASNLVNVNTTRVPSGGPYKTQSLVCRPDGCEVEHSEAVRTVYEPEHPDANGDGLVAYPNIDLAQENARMKNLIQEYDAATASCSSSLR